MTTPQPDDRPRYRFCWKNNPKRRTLYGKTCVLIARMTMNSVLVEFVDTGEQEVVSRYSIRKIKE